MAEPVQYALCCREVCPDFGTYCAEPAHWRAVGLVHDPIPPFREQHFPKGKEDVHVTTAHLLQSVNYALAHAHRHLRSAIDDKTGHNTQFNLEHAHRHVIQARDHADRLGQHFEKYYPKEGGELAEMDKEIVVPEGRPHGMEPGGG